MNSSVFSKANLIRCLVSIFVLLAIVWLVRRSRAQDVSFDGKQLSEWVVLLNKNGAQTNEAANAVQSLGVRCIPFLLKEVTLREPYSEKFERRIFDKSRSLLKYIERDRRRVAAVQAFKILGDEAKTAIEPLERALDDPETARRAAQALAAIGQSGVETLTTTAHRTNAWVRIVSIDALAGINLSTVDAINCYSNVLKDPNFNVKQSALGALSSVTNNFGQACRVVGEQLNVKTVPEKVYVLRTLERLKCTNEVYLLKIKALSNDSNDLVREEAHKVLSAYEKAGQSGQLQP